MFDKIEGSNCFGLVSKTGKETMNNFLKNSPYHTIIATIGNINGLIFTNLLANDFKEGTYTIGTHNLYIKYFNTKYTSTEFIISSDLDNPIISGIVFLDDVKDISFAYYKPDILNLNNIDYSISIEEMMDINKKLNIVSGLLI